MLEHYRLFPTHLAIIFGLIFFFLFYRFVFPRKNLHPLVVIASFSLVPVLSIFRNGVFESGQFQEHVSVSIPFFKSLIEGNFFPRWSSNACSGYGCPLFNFQYQLVYYMSSVFHFIGFSYVMSMKIVIALSYVLSGFTMYLFARREFSKQGAFVSTVLYLSAPYQFGAMHFRGSISEQMAFTIIPLVFYAANRCFAKLSLFNSTILTFFLILLFLAHQAVCLAVFPLIFLYIGILQSRKKSYKGLLSVTIGLVGFILVSSYRWVPMLLESHLISAGKTAGVEFQPFWFYIFSPINNRFGLLFQDNNGALYPNIGYFHLLVVVFIIIFILKRKTAKKLKTLTFGFVFAFFVYLYFMSSISDPAWHSIPMILYIQNAWRLIIVQAFLTSVLGGILFNNYSNKPVIYCLCLLIFTSTIFNWGNRSLDTSKEDLDFEKSTYIKEYPGKTETTTPIWVDPNSPWIGTRTEDIKTLIGKANVRELNRTTTVHQYLIETNERAVFVEQTYYYPGWSLNVNHKETTIDYKQKQYPGLMTFELPKGLHFVTFTFNDTPSRHLANLVSIASIVLLLFALAINHKISYFKPHSLK